MSRINNLGNFPDIQEVWKTYPNGGREGDYLTIEGVTYEWNKYERLWENSASVTESPARRLENVDGDMAVENDLYLGGRLFAKGGLPQGTERAVRLGETNTLNNMKTSPGIYLVLNDSNAHAHYVIGTLVVITDGMHHGVHQLLYTREILTADGVSTGHNDLHTNIYERAWHSASAPDYVEDKETWTPWVNRIPDDLADRLNRSQPVVIQGFVAGIGGKITSLTEAVDGPKPSDLFYSKDTGEIVWRRIDGPVTHYHSFWTTKNVNGNSSDRYNDPLEWTCYAGKIYIIAGVPHIYVPHNGMKKITITDIL